MWSFGLEGLGSGAAMALGDFEGAAAVWAHVREALAAADTMLRAEEAIF